MLVPLTRTSFEQLIPQIATGSQYGYYWGKWRDLLRRLLISFVALTVTWLIGKLLGSGGETIKLIFDIIAGLYWLWAPIYLASLRNRLYRRLPYSGFWRGEVLDIFITEEVLDEEENVNKWGELIIVENRERRINLEVGDRSGFRATVQAPIRRLYKVIAVGDTAEMLLLSKQPDLSRIEKITDAYLPQHDLWIGEYPWVRRDVFQQVSEELGGNSPRYSPNRRRRKR